MKEGPPDLRADRGDASPPSHFGELTINLLARGEGVALANGQKTTLSQTGIGQSQGAETFAVEFLVYVECTRLTNPTYHFAAEFVEVGG